MYAVVVCTELDRIKLPVLNKVYYSQFSVKYLMCGGSIHSTI